MNRPIGYRRYIAAGLAIIKGQHMGNQEWDEEKWQQAGERAVMDDRRRTAKIAVLRRKPARLFSVDELLLIMKPPDGWSNYLIRYIYTDRDEVEFDRLLKRLESDRHDAQGQLMGPDDIPS